MDRKIDKKAVQAAIDAYYSKTNEVVKEGNLTVAEVTKSGIYLFATWERVTPSAKRFTKVLVSQSLQKLCYFYIKKIGEKDMREVGDNIARIVEKLESEAVEVIF